MGYQVEDVDASAKETVLAFTVVFIPDTGRQLTVTCLHIVELPHAGVVTVRHTVYVPCIAYKCVGF